jgi:hypothetical protein
MFKFRIVRSFLAVLAIVPGFAVGMTGAAGATEAAWARVANGGYTILLAHGLPTGSGDPAGFELEDCATQNNLSDRGRTQARRWGTRFAARAVTITTVYTSQWCRAEETADLAFSSYRIEEQPVLNLLGALDEDSEAQLGEMTDLINGFRGPGNQIFITHPENVTALIGSAPRDGEAIIMAPAADDGGSPEIVGRILLN